MDGKKYNGPLPVLDSTSEPIVAFYLTQETNLPAIFQGEPQTVTVKTPDSLGRLVEKTALRVTFSHNQSIEEPVGLVAFGSDTRCHVRLPGHVISPIHCRIYAQLNSGPQVWLVDDGSPQGTEVKDEETSRTGKVKIVRGRRRAVLGLHSIKIGSYIFQIRAPVNNTEVRQREEWFRLNKPIPVTNSMLDRQLSGLTRDWAQMDLIGEGGYGKVFRYMEKNTALFIAIKQQKTKTTAKQAEVMKEINFMKTLRHPSLVDILFDESDNQPLPTIFTAMPLYLGNLCSVVPLPSLLTTERVMVQIAEGLHFMHSNLVLHRDMKPENILVVSPESIKIADYGLATSLKDTDSLYGMCGTTAYCAPEAFKNHEKHTTAIDVYSLGAVFYFMLDPAKVKRGWVTRYFNGHISQFNTTFENAFANPPQHFRGLVQSMLAPNPKGRYSLDECIEIVKAQKYDWVKKTPLNPKEAPPHIPAGLFGPPGIANATTLQQTPFGQAEATVKMPSPTQFAHVKRLEKYQTPQQAPVVPARKDWRPLWSKPKPAAPTPQAVPAQKPCEPAPVQRVDFNAGPPSYEEATSQNPFAKLADSRSKKRSQAQNIADPITEQGAIYAHRQSKKAIKKHLRFDGVSPMGSIHPAVQPHVSATHSGRSTSHSTSVTRTRGQHLRNARQATRRSRNHSQALNIRRTGTGRIRRNTLIGIKTGAIDIGKGLYHLGRGLEATTRNIGCLTAQGMLMLWDIAVGKEQAPNAGLPLNDRENQLLMTMKEQARKRQTENQRRGNVYLDEKKEDVQRVGVHRETGLRRIREGGEPSRV